MYYNYQAIMAIRIHLGTLEYLTNQTSWAKKGDDSPNPFTIIYGFRSRREVVIKFTQIHTRWCPPSDVSWFIIPFTSSIYQPNQLNRDLYIYTS